MSRTIVSHGLAAAVAAAWVLGGGTAARGQVSIRVEGGRRPEASIHFGGRPPRRVVPVVPPASVRYEHYRERERVVRPVVVAAPYPVAYRHPYRAEYVRRFRPGYRTIVIGSTEYYSYPALPPGYRPVVVNGVTYYLYDGVYYQPYIYEGQTVYMVVPPPGP